MTKELEQKLQPVSKIVDTLKPKVTTYPQEVKEWYDARDILQGAFDEFWEDFSPTLEFRLLQDRNITINDDVSVGQGEIPRSYS